MRIKRSTLLASAAVVTQLVGCFGGSVSEIWERGNPASFASSQSALALANCIDRNSNYSWGGTQKSSMRTLGPDHYEVVRASQTIVGVVVQVKSAANGSIAAFRFNGYDVGIAMHVADMTKGCG